MDSPETDQTPLILPAGKIPVHRSQLQKHRATFTSAPGKVRCNQPALLPDGRILGHWTRPNFNNNWQKRPQKCLNNKIITARLQMVWGVAGLRPNFFGWTGPGVLAGSGSSANQPGWSGHGHGAPSGDSSAGSSGVSSLVSYEASSGVSSGGSSQQGE
jgi:hypothetical protein